MRWRTREKSEVAEPCREVAVWWCVHLTGIEMTTFSLFFFRMSLRLERFRGVT